MIVKAVSKAFCRLDLWPARSASSSVDLLIDAALETTIVDADVKIARFIEASGSRIER